MQGKIKKIVKEKGFGFITQSEARHDTFFHMTDLANVDFAELNEGDAVEFDVITTPKGAKAVGIVLIGAGR